LKRTSKKTGKKKIIPYGSTEKRAAKKGARKVAKKTARKKTKK